MLLRSKAQSIDRVGSAVCPLPKFLRRLREGHVGGDSAVDDCLWREAKVSQRKLHAAASEWWCGIDHHSDYALQGLGVGALLLLYKTAIQGSGDQKSF